MDGILDFILRRMASGFVWPGEIMCKKISSSHLKVNGMAHDKHGYRQQVMGTHKVEVAACKNKLHSKRADV